MSAAASVANRLSFDDRFRRLLAARLANASDAEDVLQNVAEKLIRKRLDPDAGYLTRIVQNAATDQTRAELTRAGYETACGEQAERIDRRSPDRVVEAIEALEALQRAVLDLRPLCREIFVRCYVQGQTQASVAKELGLHLSTVEKRLARARLYCFDKVRDHIDLTG
ncbi:MAG: RNA polymerase sigma factor [Pseudomonadota bacterium]